jgi:hypothetical protein
MPRHCGAEMRHLQTANSICVSKEAPGLAMGSDAGCSMAWVALQGWVPAAQRQRPSCPNTLLVQVLGAAEVASQHWDPGPTPRSHWHLSGVKGLRHGRPPVE